MISRENLSGSIFVPVYFCLVALLAVIYTFPLITGMSVSFYGFPWDALGGMWHFWWVKFSYLHHFTQNTQTYLAYPFGNLFLNQPNSYLYDFTGFILTFVTNEVAARNVMILISFPALATTTYLLLHHLTKHRAVSAVIGIAYAFSPFHMIHNMAHFANLYWAPLVFLFLLRLLRDAGYKNALLLGLFWGLLFIDNAYYAYFMALLTPVCIAASLFDKEKRANILGFRFLRASLAAFILFLLIILPMVYPLIKGYFFAGGDNSGHLLSYGRGFYDLFTFSAKPLDYLLPSRYNPILGWLVPDFGIGVLKGHRYTEHTLYLGYSILLFAGYALYCVVRGAGQLGRNARDGYVVWLFLAVAITALILSAPPFIPLGDYSVDLQTKEVFADSKLYLPQYFLYKIAPMFRVYARIGVIVLLGICVLAAFGLKEILSRIEARRWRCLLLSLFALVLFVEYVELPPFRITEVKEPAVYKWLVSQPGEFPIVEYPLGIGDDPYTTYEYMFNQRIHKKYLVNGAATGTPADDFRKEIIDISNPEAVKLLAGIGVKYVVIHEDKYLSGNKTVPLDWVTAVPREKLFPVEYNNGKVPDLTMVKDRLRLVKSFKGTDVYELVEGSR